MTDILSGFTVTQINDHNPDFDLDRILAENKVSSQLSDFITYLSDSKYIIIGDYLELAVEQAAKKVDSVDQLKLLITELAPRVQLGDILNGYTLKKGPPIAPMFQQNLDDLDKTNMLHEAFPNVIALKIKKLFFDDNPLAFEEFMCWKGEKDRFFQEKFDWQKLYLFYGDDPFEIFFNAGLKWHKKLLNSGKIKEAVKWEEELKEVYHGRLKTEPKRLYELCSAQRVLQSLNIPGAKTSPEDHKRWIEAAFITGKTPYQDKNCSSETAVKYFKSSLNIIDWKKNTNFDYFIILSKSSISAEEIFLLRPDKLPIYWYASPFREEWLDCVEEHLREINISEKLLILKYLLSFSYYTITDDYAECCLEGLGQESEWVFVDEKTQHRWVSAAKSIGEDFLKGKLKLEFNELIDYFDWLFNHPKKFDFNYEDLILYADKIMAFTRPKFENPPDDFNIHECDDAYRVLLTYAPDKLLRNLLHTFRKSPVPCSGEGLEFGVGEDLRRLDKSSDTYPFHWWISIMIHNCLRTPYLKLKNLKPLFYRREPIPDNPDFLTDFDKNGKRIGDDGFAYDSQGNKLDKDGNKLSGNELKDFCHPLRQTFADFCLKGLRLKKGESVTKGEYDESQCMEPDPFWRQGFVFALSEIGLDLGGKAHKTLKFISEYDPNEHVRKYAKKAYKSIRRKQHRNEDDPVKGMLIAFWWLRLAQRNSMSEDIDRPAAARVRRNELRYSQKIGFRLLRQ